MGHYALIGENNVVLNVIVGIDENNTDSLPSGFDDWESYYASFHGLDCKRTSFNTRHNQYTSTDEDGEIIVAPDDQQTKAFRGNYASVGGTYDSERDVFLPVKPFNSWILDETTLKWQPPVDKPDDHELVPYVWNEDTTSWIEVTPDNDVEGNHFG